MPIDLKKEIKLSDLVPRRKRKPGLQAVAAPKPSKEKQRRKPRKQEIVGLKIGGSQLAAAQVVNQGSSRVVKVAREELEHGVVISGEVRDIATLSRSLDSFFTTNKLPRKNVRLGIGTNRVGVRMIEVGGLEDEKQLGNAVRFRAHEALSIPMDQAVLDYHVLGRETSATGETTHRVLVAAAYREPIDHLVAACRAANITLSGIDVEGFALLRALTPAQAPAGDGQPSAVVALAIGHQRSTLAVSDGESCDFIRVLDWGGTKLDTVIARELGISADQAATAKLDLSLAGPFEGDVVDAREARARDAVKNELTTLAREIVASLHFYQSQPGSLAISEILVTGGTTRMPGLVAELERLVKARIRVVDPLAGVEAAEGIAERDDLASLAVAIGLGVER